MSTPEPPEEHENDDAIAPPEKDDPMAALLRRSLAVPDTKQPSILRGVQKRIRRRSRGKFFADGWSTTDARISHALIALAMLIVLVIAYFALGPVGIQ